MRGARRRDEPLHESTTGGKPFNAAFAKREDDDVVSVHIFSAAPALRPSSSSGRTTPRFT